MVIGHLSEDQTPEGPSLGGAVAYAGLTAAALGSKVGILTSAADSIDLSRLAGLEVARRPAAQSTSFQNRYSPAGRRQTVIRQADRLGVDDLPADWRAPAIAHLAPILHEIDLDLTACFPESFLGLSPQGLLRDWNQHGQISPRSWQACAEFLPAADAVVVSIEDLQLDWAAAERMAARCRVLVVTEGSAGARLWTSERWERRTAVPAAAVDPTGAGDVFSALFFSLYQRTGDALGSVETANSLAAVSVGRRGLAAVPSAAEVQAVLQPMKS